MPELATCGIDMSVCEEGDIPVEYRDLIISTNDIQAFVGTWVEIKKVCDSSDTLLQKAGVGYFKRRAISVATIRTQLSLVSVDDKGNPTIHIKSFYPLGITKETVITTDGSTIDQPDPDTCDWKCTALWCNGRLVQKRTGSKGVMYDARAILKHHPTHATDQSPIMYFHWTLIDSEGNKHVVRHFLKKLSES